MPYYFHLFKGRSEREIYLSSENGGHRKGRFPPWWGWMLCVCCQLCFLEKPLPFFQPSAPVYLQNSGTGAFSLFCIIWKEWSLISNCSTHGVIPLLSGSALAYPCVTSRRHFITLDGWPWKSSSWLSDPKLHLQPWKMRIWRRNILLVDRANEHTINLWDTVIPETHDTINNGSLSKWSHTSCPKASRIMFG